LAAAGFEAQAARGIREQATVKGDPQLLLPCAFRQVEPGE
jgi:hypothetical protein